MCAVRHCKGKGTSKDFRYISHDELSKLVLFELTQNNHCWATGKLWNE